jgi:hypothetical protein
MIVPEIIIATCRTLGNQFVIYQKAVSIISRNVNDKFRRVFLESKSFAEQVHSVSRWIYSRHADPGCIPSIGSDRYIGLPVLLAKYSKINNDTCGQEGKTLFHGTKNRTSILFPVKWHPRRWLATRIIRLSNATFLTYIQDIFIQNSEYDY